MPSGAVEVDTAVSWLLQLSGGHFPDFRPGQFESLIAATVVGCDAASDIPKLLRAQAVDGLLAMPPALPGAEHWIPFSLMEQDAIDTINDAARRALVPADKITEHYLASVGLVIATSMLVFTSNAKLIDRPLWRPRGGIDRDFERSLIQFALCRYAAPDRAAVALWKLLRWCRDKRRTVLMTREDHARLGRIVTAGFVDRPPGRLLS